MSTRLYPFSDEQIRVLVNIRQQYEVWMETERALAVMPDNLVRKEVNRLRLSLRGTRQGQ